MSSPAEWTIALYLHLRTAALQVLTHFIHISNIWGGLRATHLTPVGFDRVVSYCNLILFILNPSLWRYYFMLVYMETCFASFSVFFFLLIQSKGINSINIATNCDWVATEVGRSFYPACFLYDLRIIKIFDRTNWIINIDSIFEKYFNKGLPRNTIYSQRWPRSVSYRN